MSVLIRRASGGNEHAHIDPVWEQDLPRCNNFWCVPLGVAVRSCLQCWAAGALVQGYVVCTKIQLVKCCLLSACVSGITSFFNGDTEFFKSFLCSVHQTQCAKGKILNSVPSFLYLSGPIFCCLSGYLPLREEEGRILYWFCRRLSKGKALGRAFELVFFARGLRTSNDLCSQLW